MLAGTGNAELHPAAPRQSLTTGTAAWKRWAKALLTTGGHFFNNAVQSNFILSVPFMLPCCSVQREGKERLFLELGRWRLQ